MAFALLSRSRSKTQGSVKPVPKGKSARAQHPADSRFGFAKPVFQPQTAALPMPPVIQTKLKVGEPNDKFEQEADRVADEVMRMPEPDPINQPGADPSIGQRIQRLCPECEEELHRQPIDEDEEEETLQAKENTGHTPPQVTSDLESSIQSLKGGGQPLPKSVRAFFEPRFGVDFSGVRAHTDGRAAQLAQAVKARAFTVGCDVVFGAGQYAPQTASGQRLLAHELIHVVQQQGGAVSRHHIDRKPDEGEARGLAQQNALLMASLITVENVGERLLNALGTKTEKAGGSVIASLVSALAGATVAGVLAWKLTAIVVSEAGRAAVTKFLTKVAEESASGIVDAIGSEDVNLEKFVRQWKIQQRTVLRNRFLEVYEGKRGEPSDLERALSDADIKSSEVGEVEDTVFKEVLSLYLRALRETTYRRHEESFFGDVSGRGWAHIQLRYGNKSRVHADLIGIESADLKALSVAFEQTGFDPVEVGIPVVLTIDKPPALASQQYRYETWWVWPNYGQLWTEKYMMYSHHKTLSREAGGEGSSRRGKEQANDSLWREGFGLKLPVPTGFGGSVSIKDWREVNVT